jgi:hypothetical protein
MRYDIGAPTSSFFFYFLGSTGASPQGLRLAGQVLYTRALHSPSNFILLHEGVQLSQHCLLKRLFPLLGCPGPLVGRQWNTLRVNFWTLRPVPHIYMPAIVTVLFSLLWPSGSFRIRKCESFNLDLFTFFFFFFVVLGMNPGPQVCWPHTLPLKCIFTLNFDLFQACLGYSRSLLWSYKFYYSLVNFWMKADILIVIPLK